MTEETRAHNDRSLWPDVEDPATQHPMSPRIVQIQETYKRLYKETGKEQPLIKHARYDTHTVTCHHFLISTSFISVKEAMAAGEMGLHSATISHQVLTELAKLPYDASKQPGEGKPKPAHVYRDAGALSPRFEKLMKIDPLAPPDWDGTLASTEIDYLANNGAELEKAIEADPTTKNRLRDALDLFIDAEKKSQAKIEEAMKLV